MTVRRTLQGHEGWVNSAEFSPDSKFIATASPDKPVKIWDPETGNSHKTLEVSHSMESPEFSRDGRLLVSTCRDRTQIRIWETAYWDLIKSIHCDNLTKGNSRYPMGVEFQRWNLCGTFGTIICENLAGA
ncbi:unnamed protein product [Penicillium manginii]